MLGACFIMEMWHKAKIKLFTSYLLIYSTHVKDCQARDGRRHTIYYFKVEVYRVQKIVFCSICQLLSPGDWRIIFTIHF